MSEKDTDKTKMLTDHVNQLVEEVWFNFYLSYHISSKIFAKVCKTM